MTDLKQRFEREVRSIRLGPDALGHTMRRVRRRRRVRRVGTAGFALLVAAVAIGSAAITLLRAGHEATPVTPGSPTPSANVGPVRRQIVGSGYGFGSMWLVTCDDCTDAAVTSGRARGTLARIDPQRQRVIADIRVKDPQGMAVGSGAVWVTNFAANSVQRIDPSTNRVVATIPLVLPFEVSPGDVAFLPEDIAIGDGAVWVSTARSAVARIDPTTNRVVAIVRVQNDILGDLAVGDGSVWVTADLGGLVRIDARTNTIVGRVPPVRSGKLRLSYSAITIGNAAVFATGEWVNSSGTVIGASGLAEIDERTGTVSKTIQLLGPASDPGVQVWIVGPRLVTVALGYVGEIDLPSLTQVPSFRALPGGPGAPLVTVVAQGSVWAVGLDGSVQPIGP